MRAGLELGQADTLSFVGVVIGLHHVRNSTVLLCLNIRVELDNEGALPVSIAPPFTGGPILLEPALTGAALGSGIGMVAGGSFGQVVGAALKGGAAGYIGGSAIDSK